jgi:hypothetical protein
VRFVEGLVVAERFRLVRPLGQGGMGAVWLAQHIGLDVPCALKFIHEQAAQSVELRARFEREAKAAAQLRTPHVVQILDHGVWQEIPYIAMEYLEGEDLGQRLARTGPLSPPDTVSVVVQVGRALTKAHAAGLVHRDLKPANIFLVRDDDREIAKVLDFGVAKVKEMGLDGSTKTGAIMGTPYYMSPEQARASKDIDHRSDLWALAVVTYQCLTGRLPFPGDALGELLVKIIMDPLPVPSQAAPVPPGFDAWWLRAVARDPAQRFQTARDMGEALSLALGVTVMAGVEVGSIMAGPSSGPVSGLAGGSFATRAAGTPMPRALTMPSPGTPLPGGMTPSGPMDAPPSSGPGGAPTPLPQAITIGGTAGGTVESTNGSTVGGGSLGGSIGGGASTVAGSVDAPPRRRAGLFVALSVGVAVLGAGAFFTFRGGSHGSDKAPASSAATTGASDPPAPSALPAAAASATASTPAAEPTSAVLAPSDAGAATAAVSAAPPSLAAGPKRIAGPMPAATGKPHAKCDPNYYLDAEGQKHFKPECFK